MKFSKAAFHLCRIFLDETEFKFQGTKHFMVGGVFLPVDCDLFPQLGQVRIKENFIGALHFADATEEKEFRVMNGFLRAFIDSNAIFRAITVNARTWEKWENHIGRAKLSALLLSYPWMCHRDSIHNSLSAARLTFDRQSLNYRQQEEFSEILNRMLRRKNSILGESTTKLRDSSVLFAPREASCELQLTDIILGVVRISYLINEGANIKTSRKNLHDNFLKYFPLIKTLVAADRRKTRQKIDIWHKK